MQGKPLLDIVSCEMPIQSSKIGMHDHNNHNMSAVNDIYVENNCCSENISKQFVAQKIFETIVAHKIFENNCCSENI